MKEKSAERSIEEVRNAEFMNTSARVGSFFKASCEKTRMRESLENWAQVGFKMTKTNQKRFSAVASPDLLDLTKRFYTKTNIDGAPSGSH